MGEIADMMLDGTLCEGCGEYLGEEVGYPQYCETCEADRNKNQQKKPPSRKTIPNILAQPDEHDIQ